MKVILLKTTMKGASDDGAEGIKIAIVIATETVIVNERKIKIETETETEIDETEIMETRVGKRRWR
jgi:hypothetical protein